MSVCTCECVHACVCVDILAVSCYTRMHLRLFAENGWAALGGMRTATRHEAKPGTSNRKSGTFLDNGWLLEK